MGAVIQCLAHRRELNPELVRLGSRAFPQGSPSGSKLLSDPGTPGRGEYGHFWCFSPLFLFFGRRQEILVACYGDRLHSKTEAVWCYEKHQMLYSQKKKKKVTICGLHNQLLK